MLGFSDLVLREAVELSRCSSCLECTHEFDVVCRLWIFCQIWWRYLRGVFVFVLRRCERGFFCFWRLLFCDRFCASLIPLSLMVEQPVMLFATRGYRSGS